MGATGAGTRHHLFDGLRGVAALGVALFHLGPGAGLAIMPAGYLAVDFFFLLSGFVIARAYGARLRDGLGLRPFMALRLARLYPVFAIGILFGVPMLWVMAQKASPPVGGGGAALALVANLALLPAPGGFATLFPGNLVCWSLMLEIAINLAFAAGGHRLPNAVLLLLAGLAAAGLALSAQAFGTLNGGAYRSDAVLGVWRVCFAFPLGVVIGRLRTPVARSGALAPGRCWRRWRWRWRCRCRWAGRWPSSWCWCWRCSRCCCGGQPVSSCRRPGGGCSPGPGVCPTRCMRCISRCCCCCSG